MQSRASDATSYWTVSFDSVQSAISRAALAVRTSRKVARATVAQAWQDRILGLSAEAGFWALLSLTPLLLVLISAIGEFAPLFGPQITVLVRTRILHAAGKFLVPAAVHNVLAPVLNDVTEHGGAGLLSVGTVFILWSGSTAMSTYVNTITIAYGLRDIRSAVRTRLLAFGLYVGTVLIGSIALPLLIIVPGWIVEVLPSHIQPIAEPFITYGYWPTVIVVCTAAITALYHFAVPVRSHWRRDLPGAILAMVLWLAISYALRTYLAYEISHSPTYGALSAPIAALLFLYVTSLALLFGAELNAQIRYARKNTERPEPATGRFPASPALPVLPAQASRHAQDTDQPSPSR